MIDAINYSPFSIGLKVAGMQFNIFNYNGGAIWLFLRSVICFPNILHGQPPSELCKLGMELCIGYLEINLKTSGLIFTNFDVYLVTGQY